MMGNASTLLVTIVELWLRIDCHYLFECIYSKIICVGLSDRWTCGRTYDIIVESFTRTLAKYVRIWYTGRYTGTALPFLNRGVSSVDVTGKFELRV